MPLHRKKLYARLPSRRVTNPTDPSMFLNDEEAASEREEQEKYAEGWADAHALDDEDEEF